jgi:hypothetical protein
MEASKLLRTKVGKELKKEKGPHFNKTRDVQNYINELKSKKQEFQAHMIKKCQKTYNKIEGNLSAHSNDILPTISFLNSMDANELTPEEGNEVHELKQKTLQMNLMKLYCILLELTDHATLILVKDP